MWGVRRPVRSRARVSWARSVSGRKASRGALIATSIGGDSGGTSVYLAGAYGNGARGVVRLAL